MDQAAFFASIRARWGVAAVVMALVVVGIGYFAFRPSQNLETITLTPRAYVQTVQVTGHVTAAHDAALGFSQSGRVAGVFARVGDRVAAGAVLANIENADLRAMLLQRQAARDAQKAKLAALVSGTRPEQIALKESAVTSARVASEQAQAALVNSILDAYRASDDAVHNKLDTMFSNPRSGNAQLVFLTSDSAVKSAVESERIAIEDRLAQWRTQVAVLMPDSDATSAIAITQQNLSAVAQLLQDANAAVNHAITSTGYPQATLDAFTASVAGARTSTNASLNSFTAALTAERSAQAAVTTTERDLTLAKAGSTQDDIDAQAAQLKASEADVASALAAINKTIVVAPFSGIITKMDAKVGEIVSPSASMIQLQSTGTFQIETYVPEVSISAIRIGNAASTTLDAYGSGTDFDARVVSIDPAETVQQGVSTYKVVLEYVAKDPRILSGMTADVVIRTSEKASALVVPSGVVGHRAQTAYIDIMRDGQVVERSVTLGALSASGEVELLSGAQPGDVVLITPR